MSSAEELIALFELHPDRLYILVLHPLGIDWWENALEERGITNVLISSSPFQIQELMPIISKSASPQEVLDSARSQRTKQQQD